MNCKERVRQWMIDEMGSTMMAWEIPGPSDTSVDCIQCWSVPASSGDTRLIIVEFFEDDAGWYVFPQIQSDTIDHDTIMIKALDATEVRIKSGGQP